MVGFWRVANRAKKIYKKRLDFMLAGSRLYLTFYFYVLLHYGAYHRSR